MVYYCYSSNLRPIVSIVSKTASLCKTDPIQSDLTFSFKKYLVSKKTCCNIWEASKIVSWIPLKYLIAIFDLLTRAGQTLAYGSGNVANNQEEGKKSQKFAKDKVDKRRGFETYQALSIMDIKPSAFRAKQMAADTEAVT